MNKCIIASIVVLLKGYQRLKASSNSNKMHISSLKYVLGQTVRAYKVPKEQIFISQAAEIRWNDLTSSNINNFDYKQSFICDRLKQSITCKMYKGSQKNGQNVQINPNDKVCFNDMFHVDHIVPVKLIMDELLKLTQINSQNVSNILQKMYLCRMLKEEDRLLGRTSGRTLCYKNNIIKIYKTRGICVKNPNTGSSVP